MNNTNQYYENLSVHLDSFFSAMREEHAKLIAESNEQANEARALIARVQETARKHEALHSIMERVSDEALVQAEQMETIVNNIKDAMKDLYDSDLPDCAVEQFEGYCENCGEEILTDTFYGIGANGEMLCETCFEEEEIPEEEPSDEEDVETETEGA